MYVNQSTQQPHGSGECPLCECPCSKSDYLEDVPKIKAELIFEKRVVLKLLRRSSRETNNCRYNETGHLAQETGKASLLGKT